MPLRHDPAPPGGVRGTIATVVFTLLSNLVLLAITPSLALLGIVAAFVPPRGDWMMPVARLWSRLYLWASGVRLETDYDAALDRARGVVFLANHQSMVDVAVLMLTLPGQARFVAKRSLFRIPFFGWSLSAAGFVPVDRSDVRSARASFAAAIELLRGGRSIVLFPEETRSTDGRLLPFKRGGVLLALKTGYPIVPVGIRGTRHVRPKGSWLTTPWRVRVRYGRPIEAAGGLAGRDELVTAVRAEIERLAFGD
ncbi:MAG: lysophospholipid acyltransferase family protein [Acidobacteriota bacterium]